MIVAALTLAMLLVIWFETEAFVEYMKLFRLTFLCKVDEYLKVDAASSDLSYLEFLQEYFDCFLTRLVSCPVCLSVWLGLCIAQASFLPVAFLGLSFFYLFRMLMKNGNKSE